MVDPPIRQARPAWLWLRLSLFRALLAERGSRLLAAELIITLTSTVVALPFLLTGVISDLIVAVLTWGCGAVVGTLFTAWAWSASLAILSQDLSDDSPPIATVIAIPLSVLTTVAYYIIYLARTETSSVGAAVPLSYEDSD